MLKTLGIFQKMMSKKYVPYSIMLPLFYPT